MPTTVCTLPNPPEFAEVEVVEVPVAVVADSEVVGALVTVGVPATSEVLLRIVSVALGRIIDGIGLCKMD